MVVLFYSIEAFAPKIYITLTKCFTDFFQLAATMEQITPDDLPLLFINGLSIFITAAAPFLLLSAFLTILLTGVQTRFLVSSANFKFKGSRLNPLQGLKKMISMRGLVEMVKAILKIVVLGWIVYDILLKKVALLPRLLDMSIEQAVVMVGDIVMSLVGSVGAVFAFLAAADFLYQWWEHEKSLRMSKQDIKEEYKQTEGDPQIKGKIKERQQQMSQRRMMQEVPKADVIIRNPTHYAVAIKYDSKHDRAPIVIAKGADRIALKIIEIGEQNKIHITENRPLARGLYESVDLGREVPEEFYQAVAGVLAFVYALKHKKL